MCPPLARAASEEERDLTDEVRPSRRVRGGTRAAGRTAPDGVTESAAGEGAPPTAAADPGDEPTTRPWEPQATETAAVSDAVGHPELLGTSRPADPRICPFLRLERDGELVAPLEVVSDRHLCVAFGEPRPQSERQQELLCLQAAHSNCARYLRGVADPEAPATRSRIPRPTVLAAVLLLASIGFSFGFVLQRGGLELTGFQLLSQSTGSSRPAPPDDRRGDCVPRGLRPGRVDQPPPGRDRDRDRRADRHTGAADTRPHRRPHAWPFAEPDAWPSHSPSPCRRRARAPSRPRREPCCHPCADAAAHGDARPTSDRFAVMTRCPGRSDCWIYTIRTGDNLFSIAHWFGVSLDRIYAMNPWARTRGIQAGNDLPIRRRPADDAPPPAPRRRATAASKPTAGSAPSPHVTQPTAPPPAT